MGHGALEVMIYELDFLIIYFWFLIIVNFRFLLLISIGLLRRILKIY